MSSHSRRAVIATLAVASLALAACGDDDDGADATPAPPTSTAVDPGPTGGTVAGASLDEAISSLDLETRAEAMARAVGAERFEVDGSTVHLYLEDAEMSEMSACIGGGAVLDDGESIVLHSPGVEIPC